MLVLDDLLDFVLAVVVVYFMRKIAREHEGLVADGLDQMMQRLFSPFTTDIYPSSLDVTADVSAHRLSRFEPYVFSSRIVLNMSFPTSVKPFETGLEPRDSRFHEAYAYVGKLIQDAVKD